MQIITTNSNPNFNAKLRTVDVLETTSRKIFYNSGIDGFKNVIYALLPQPGKFVGCRGYRYYAQILGKKIIEKYPVIAQATQQIIDIAEKNPFIKKQDLYKKIIPIIDEIGEEIDIEI